MNIIYKGIDENGWDKWDISANVKAIGNIDLFLSAGKPECSKQDIYKIMKEAKNKKNAKRVY